MRQTSRYLNFNPSQRHALDARRNLVIRANAGSGKTSVLIERIVQIMARGLEADERVSITQIAAITFTRKAAAELQGRLRQAFDDEHKRATDRAESDYWLAAARDLTRATIGTIDSLCGRILREFHWELHGPDHIDIDFQPLDSYDQSLFQQEAIDRVINRASAADATRPERAAVDWWGHREGFAQLIGHLRELLNHAIEPDRIVAAHTGQISIEEQCRRMWDESPAVAVLEEYRDSLAPDIRTILALLGDKPKGKYLTELHEKCSRLLELLEDAGSEIPILDVLSDILLTQKKEPRSMYFYKAVAPQLQALQAVWAEALAAGLPDLAGEEHAMRAAGHLVALLGPVQAEYLALCRQANRYDFLTVARRARRLLQTSASVRQTLRQRYRYVMIDEFQDTNPLQWEIIAYIVGDGPDGLLDRDRLCIVGDPQQSIFRFRQADVRVFHRAQEKIAAANRHYQLTDLPMPGDGDAGGVTSNQDEREGLVSLAENYRSLSPVPLLLMDQVFRYSFDPVVHKLDPDVDKFEIRYQPLAAGLQIPQQGEVRYIYIDEPEAGGGEGASEEGEEDSPQNSDLVAAQVEAVAGELAKLWGTPRLNPKAEEPANLRWRDMAILLPSRTDTLNALERALRERRIPFVVFGGIGFWQRQEIRDLVSLASWLADPGDELSLFVALRSPLAVLTDSEIFFLSQLGRGSLWRGLNVVSSSGEQLPDTSGQPSTSRRPEAPGLAAALQQTWNIFPSERRSALQETARRLRRWRDRTDRLSHADLLQRALEESGAYALYAVLPEGEQILANQRQFFEEIRAEEAASALGLSRLARRLRLQVDEFEKEGQANLATGDDAVQIMTVHSAKGLEFPVVAVLKMEGAVMRPGGASLMVEDQDDGPHPLGTVHVAVRHPAYPLRTFVCQGLQRLRDLDQRQQIAEKRRLFYVAGTRASERLILAGRATKTKLTWQRWFEEALEMNDTHRQAGFWQHPQHGWGVTIVRGSSPEDRSHREALALTVRSVDLDPIVESSLTPQVAATHLQDLRGLADDARALELRHVLHLNATPPTALLAWQRSGELSAQERGAIVGQLVHRALMTGISPLKLEPRLLEQRLHTLARALLERGAFQKEEEAPGPENAEVERVAGAALRVFSRLRRQDAAAVEICELMQAPGKTEAPFALTLGRWLIRGRFDKLIAAGTASGYTLVDWKSGSGPGARDRYGSQMQLYALALARSGQAARIAGAVQVRLVFLETAEIVLSQFNDEELQAFGSEVERDLQRIDEICNSLKVAGRAVPRESVGG
jgi:ATP-dependent helicase/nuclease subunit A